MTDANALGPSQMGIVLKSATTYNEPGLPKPPAGWGRQLSLSEEAMESKYPDLNDSD